MRTTCITAAMLTLALLGPVPSRATEYIGLWRVDEAAPGIAVDYPENGFAGACVRFSNGGPEAGDVKLTSQINRYRFDSLSLSASGTVDPLAVHVQLSVKGKTAWGALDHQFTDVPVGLVLDGQEVTLEARELEAVEGEWSVTLCNLEFANPHFALRFTSDCAGFDFDSGDGWLRLLADEDWLALEREMTGGMALFHLASAWDDEDVDLSVETTFPDQLFYTALAVDEAPVLQPQGGVAAVYDYQSGASGDYALVVKAKGPVVGTPEWRTALTWSATPEPVELVSDLVAGDMIEDTIAVEVEADVVESRGKSSGCTMALDRRSGPAGVLLVLLFVLGCYLRTSTWPGRRPAPLGQGRTSQE